MTIIHHPTLQQKSLSQYDIILLSTAEWDHPFWTNKQHVALNLSQLGYRVLYVDSLGLRQPSATAQDLGRIWKRLVKAIKPPRKVRDNLWVWSPVVFPFQKISLIRFCNRILLNIGLIFLTNCLNFKKKIFWTYNPLTTEFFNLNCFDYIVYHCVDEIKAQPGMPTQLLEVAEPQLCRRADIIFTTSVTLQNQRKQWNDNTYYFPNVADFNHFYSALNLETEIPQDLKEIPCPRIGFMGAISEYKLDFDLIKKIAQCRPRWSLVLIGPIGEGDPWTDQSNLEGMDNIYLLGYRPYFKLPHYLKGIDVAILPNLINNYTKAMFPMKFFEYLAAGKPIVSTNIPAITEFANYIEIADSLDDFVVAIEKSLVGDGGVSISERLALAKRYTYDNRTQQMLDIMEKKLSQYSMK